MNLFELRLYIIEQLNLIIHQVIYFNNVTANFYYSMGKPKSVNLYLLARRNPKLFHYIADFYERLYNCQLDI